MLHLLLFLVLYSFNFNIYYYLIYLLLAAGINASHLHLALLFQSPGRGHSICQMLILHSLASGLIQPSLLIAPSGFLVPSIQLAGCFCRQSYIIDRARIQTWNLCCFRPWFFLLSHLSPLTITSLIFCGNLDLVQSPMQPLVKYCPFFEHPTQAWSVARFLCFRPYFAFCATSLIYNPTILQLTTYNYDSACSHIIILCLCTSLWLMTNSYTFACPLTAYDHLCSGPGLSTRKRLLLCAIGL